MISKPGNSYYKLIYILFNIFILYIPVNSYFEVSEFLRGGLTDWTVVNAPWFVKAFKDGFLILCLLLSLRFFPRPFDKPLFPFWIFMCLLVLFAIFAFAFMPFQIVLIGIRSYWSILFIFIGFVYKDFDIKKIFICLSIIFLLHFGLQLVEMLYAPPIFNKKVFGLNLRNPGVFMIPGIGGAFAIFCYYVFTECKAKKLRILSVVSLILSNSTIGLFCLGFYLLVKFLKRVRYWYLLGPIIVIFAALFFINLGIITGRGDNIWVSVLTRVHIFNITFLDLNNFLIGYGFGNATSAALLAGSPEARIPDNTLAGVYLNMGFLGLLMMLSIYYKAFKTLPKLLMLVFFCYGFSQLIFEMYPVIQLLLLLFGTLLARKYYERKYDVLNISETEPIRKPIFKPSH